MEKEDVLREIQVLQNLMLSASHVGEIELSEMAANKIKLLLKQLEPLRLESITG